MVSKTKAQCEFPFSYTLEILLLACLLT